MKRLRSIRSFLSFATIALFFALPAKAQFKPGTLMIGTTVGSIGYSSDA